jgi:hypothetical protein
MITGSVIQAQTLIREFVAPDPQGAYTNANTQKPLIPGTTYQVLSEGTLTYLVCIRNCPPTVVTPPPAPVIIQQQQGCSDCISVDNALRLVAEQRLMAETIMRYQQQNVGTNNNSSNGSRMSQEEFYLSNRQLDLMESAAKTQKRQGAWGIALNTMLGAAGVGMQAWNNVLVRQGYYQSNLSSITNVINQGGGGTTNPGGGPWTGGNTPPNNGSNNNGGNVYADNDPLWNTAGSSGSGLSSGTTNTIFTGTNGGGGGGPFTGGTTNTRRTNATDLLNGW